jgi:hypothetical protein
MEGTTRNTKKRIREEKRILQNLISKLTSHCGGMMDGKKREPAQTPSPFPRPDPNAGCQ